MTTPSTNKCIKCGEEIKYGMTFTRNANGTAQHAPGDWCKPTVPSVCGVRVQTAEGVNIPCRLPRPCKDHEPSEVTPKHDKPDCALRMKLGKHVLTSHTGAPLDCSCSCHTPQQEEASSNKTIEELVDDWLVDLRYCGIEESKFRTALTKAYEAGQVDSLKPVLGTLSGLVDDIKEEIILKAKTDI